MRTGENVRKRIDGRYEARYIKNRTADGKAVLGFCYGKTYEEAKRLRDEKVRQLKGEPIEPEVIETETPRQMKLLILGAGGHGHVVRETALALNIFDNISFLDDDVNNKEAIGACSDYLKYKDRYAMAFPAFGNNVLRMKWITRLEEAGFIIPRLIHPDAVVSKSAVIGSGTIIEAKAMVNARTVIGKSCIIAIGAIVDCGAQVKDYCHIDCSAAVMMNSIVEPAATISSGSIVNTKLIS